MAYQPEATTYDTGVYQIETTDPVDGGVGSITNSPLLSLANRTNYLKSHVDALEAGTTLIAAYATKASPALTGSPTTPNQAVGDDSTKIANTAFVQDAVNGLVTVSIAGSTTTTLTQAQYGYPLIVLSGAVTAAKSVVFPTQTGWWLVTNSSTGAYTVTLKTASGTGVYIPMGYSGWIYCDGTNIVNGTSFASTLTVAGATALSGTLTVAGSVALAGILSVAGATTLTGAATLKSTLEVVGATTLDSTLSVAGAITSSGGITDTNVTTAAGGIVSAYRLGVVRSGGVAYATFTRTDLADGTPPSADTSLMLLSAKLASTTTNFDGGRAVGTYMVYATTGGGGKNYVDARNSSGTVTSRILLDGDAGNMTLTGAATLSSTLAVAGATTLTGAATLSSTLSVAGATTLTGAATLGSSLVVTGATSLKGSLGVTGTATLQGAVGISSTLEVAQAAKMDSTLDVKGLATLEAGAAVTGALSVTGNITTTGGGLIAGLATLTSNVLRLQCADSTNAANVHLWMYNYDGTERALMYADSAATFHFRSLGASDSMSLDASGNAVLKGNVTSGGTVFGGGGTSYLATNGDIYGSTWGGLLSTYLSSSLLTAAKVGAATAGLAVGAVGTYALCAAISTKLSPGSTIAGSSLLYSDVYGDHSTVAPSGTWMCMGYVPNSDSSRDEGSTTLFLRIA